MLVPVITFSKTYRLSLREASGDWCQDLRDLQTLYEVARRRAQSWELQARRLDISPSGLSYEVSGEMEDIFDYEESLKHLIDFDSD